MPAMLVARGEEPYVPGWLRSAGTFVADGLRNVVQELPNMLPWNIHRTAMEQREARRQARPPINASWLWEPLPTPIDVQNAINYADLPPPTATMQTFGATYADIRRVVATIDPQEARFISTGIISEQMPNIDERMALIHYLRNNGVLELERIWTEELGLIRGTFSFGTQFNMALMGYNPAQAAFLANQERHNQLFRTTGKLLKK